MEGYSGGGGAARSCLWLVQAAAILLGWGQIAWAGGEVHPAVPQAQPEDRRITVTAPYAGDDNGDGTLKIEWGLTGAGWGEGDRLGEALLDHAASPYRHTIPALQNGTSYQVRLTFIDPDGVVPPDPQVLTGIVPHNPRVHSSLSTGSSRWSAQHGWGVKGGKYGEFTCATCHIRGTRNIKMVRESLAVTDPESTDQLPTQAAGGSVSLQSTAPGSADLGDDTRVPANTSTNVCEACHSRTKYHNFNVADNSGGTGHYNKADCISCHKHDQGFAASCGACHANPPAWGSHPAHLAAEGSMAPPVCVDCHGTAVHLNALSEVSFGSAPRLTGGTYSDQGGDETSRYTVEGGYGTTPLYGTCGNLYCHSTGSPFDRAAVYRTPQWGGGAPGCAGCHDGGGAATTLSAKHAKHTDPAKYGFDCSRCHSGTAASASTIADRALHVNKAKDVSFAAGGSYDGTARTCVSTVCHSDGRGGAPNVAAAWSGGALGCTGCHNGRIGETPEMESNAHHRLANSSWIRKYPCTYCHNATVDGAGAIKSWSRHVNGTLDIAFDPKWKIPGRPDPSYNAATKVCDNIYCHSDGTTVNPEVRDFPWNSATPAECDSCHGHQGDCASCHVNDGITGWTPEDQWKKSVPMYANSGPGTERANSHVRHLETEFSCENCHADTVVGSCQECHDGGIPTTPMTEAGHVKADHHVNKIKDVVFKNGGTYNTATKRCSATVCHTGSDPRWGDSVNSEVLCLNCHGTTGPDSDDYNANNGVQGKINTIEWASSGHGRPASKGNYLSGNPPASFPGNPCWYCHDNEVLHKDARNPFRLKMHPQFEKRFEKECVFCHMTGTDAECLGCHNSAKSLSRQLSQVFPPDYSVDHRPYADGETSCLTAGCHPDDASQHKSGAGSWSAAAKADIKNQYMMMGVCLQCHDNDRNGRCNTCHTWSGDPAQNPYRLGYDPGTGFISGSSKASSTHFGYKHYNAFTGSGGFADANSDGKFDGLWRGGKFCWDCHDPHGDGTYEGGVQTGNIYMIQSRVTTVSDGTFGIPVESRPVIFTKKTSGLDYVRSSAPYTGICNVCHVEVGQYYRYNFSGTHQGGRICTSCHQHGFGEGHGSGQACNGCHQNRPAPNHLGFGLPRDCTKCHEGAIKKRMDIMGQMRAPSHHVQGVPVTNKHCYECHWEADEYGMVNNAYHEGYNTKTHARVPNAKVDLVIYGEGHRPETYQEGTTAVTFTAEKIGTVDERSEVTKVTQHCLGCHSDQNNDFSPLKPQGIFGDCKTPRQYAWDRSSIAARYSNLDTVTWGKYPGNASGARKNITKALSAHGNAVGNKGGWNNTVWEDGDMSAVNTRAGNQNVQCFDCHNSHGSFTTGVTSSYVTFDGTYNGGNLKETQAGKGGYANSYRAQPKTDGVNPMAAGAAQCFDCHETQNAGEVPRGYPATYKAPWGYASTYGASAPIQGYADSSRFEGGMNGIKTRFAYRAGKTSKGGHLKASSALTTPVQGAINGLCTPCHDPHGVTRSLGSDMPYALPLLKGTWMTSPYKEDWPQLTPPSSTPRFNSRNTSLDRNVFGAGGGPSEDASRFAGLCLTCHPKSSLTDGTNKGTWKSVDRIHETVKGWGSNAEHKFTCSKCHKAHGGGLGRLMRTNCLDRTKRPAGTYSNVWSGSQGRYPSLYNTPAPCHESASAKGGSWTDQGWNNITPW